MFIDPNLDKDLGEFLIEKNVATPGQIDEARKEQLRLGGYLSTHLIERGILKDSAFATFLTCHYGFSYLPLKAYNISETALKALPARVARDFCVFPVEKSERLLSITMADPLNKGVVEFLRQLTHSEVIVFISTYSEIREAIRNYFGEDEASRLDRLPNDTVLRDDLVTPFISHSLYTGVNRRRYRRLYQDVELDYRMYPHTIRTNAKNISMSGVLFESNMVLPKGSQLTLALFLDGGRSISAVVDVNRCESKKLANTVFGDDSRVYNLFEVGAAFTFVSNADQEALADFLRQKILP
ncbi:MAG: PilZ domain-containing protein [Deltaproteobacteria bacterium]